jgi:hypothetical protein
MPERRSHSKRVVAVTGIESLWGPSLLRELLQAGENLVALLGQKTTAAAFETEIRQGRLQLVWGRGEDSARLHSLLAIHEVTLLFHLSPLTDAMGSSLVQAVRRYHPQLPVITLQQPSHAGYVRQFLQAASLLYGIAEVEELFGPELPRSTAAVQEKRSEAVLDRPNLSAPEEGQGPEARRDYVYVSDAVLALRILAQEVTARRQSICLPFRSGWQFTAREWHTLRAKAEAGEPWMLTPETPRHPFGWHPQQSLREALQASFGSDSASVACARSSLHQSSRRRAA